MGNVTCMPSTAEMIESFLSGEKEAFEFIHNIYKNKLWTFLCARANSLEDAEELFNIISCVVYQDLASLEDPDKLISWVITIAVRRVANFYQKRRPETVRVEDFVTIIQDPDLSAEEKMLKREQLIHLRGCINKLPEPQQTYIRQQFLEEKSQKEIAEEHHLNLNALKTHVLRSKRKLVDCMRRGGLLPA